MSDLHFRPEDFNFSEVKLVDVPAYYGASSGYHGAGAAYYGAGRDGAAGGPGSAAEVTDRSGEELMDTTEKADDKQEVDDGEEVSLDFWLAFLEKTSSFRME